ncbi:metallo-beta-lactamase family protein [Enhygromyxa salina]|uniref:Metallo-beta-lactamase family protein n=1 Tax=Enhygromyxa salina TaxID=215803 RepID=A0A0C2D458_9BACT|nr:MBL fold metallo-hydrolase [Enhygromyxa salina]KIG14882.1 metallo-beta-lactamase family protein [Enhygromyxa salina]
MFATTFLGHQGWLIETATTNVLLDPLLGDRFGHGGLVGEVYPPREFDFAAFPPIDAVLLSHEHDDHFDLPSLDRLDRDIPIYLSSRSSIAASELLSHMGFAAVRPLEPESSLELGELRVLSFCADHRGGRQADEWDVFPLLIQDRGGHGSLFTSIDVRPRDADLSRLRALGSAGVWAVANNCSRASFQELRSLPRVNQSTEAPASGREALARAEARAENSRAREPVNSGPPDPSLDDTPALARALERRHALLAASWGAPLATLICGGGWSFDRARAWMNHHLFPIDSQRLASALAELTGSGRVSAPIPGHSVVMRDAAIVATHSERTFLRARPPASWPARDYRGEGPLLQDYASACGRTRLGSNGRETLVAELVDFARYLYGTPLFCELHSLPAKLDSGAWSRLCLSLRDDDAPVTLVYEPRACAFVSHACPDPTVEFAAGLECWATDLLALLEGELAPSALCYAGRLRSWNHAPGLLRASAHLLWDFGHPLRRPDRAARLYRRLLAAQTDREPSVRAP